MSVAWLDCSAGVAGDMLLGALLDAGADLDVVRAAVKRVDPILDITVETTARHGITATKATVIDTSTGKAADADEPANTGHHHHPPHTHGHGHGDGHGHEHSHPHDHDEPHGRPWAEVRRLILAAELSETVTRRSIGAFSRLADAEAAVHGTTLDEVHFHEVGALDAIGDVVGCVAALDNLGLTRLSASVVTVGSGDQTLGQHGRIPIPGPAVTHLARAARMPVVGGPVTMEMATPTGAALLAEYVTDYGPAPVMVIDRVGVGAGTRDPHRLANVVRILIGTGPDRDGGATPTIPTEEALIWECNVDDLDPRIWPTVLAALLDVGAADAWLVPITMKKGRPAHELRVLGTPGDRDALLAVIASHTSTLGIREIDVTKHVLDRHVETVTVNDHPVRVKLGLMAGRVVNAQPEFDDVADLAAQQGIPVKVAMARATAAAAALWGSAARE